ncbi:MAG: RNA methyltransferase [archaeon]|nr:RNA methyltransferase [archaeon]
MAEERRKKVEEYYKNKLEDVELLIDNVWDPHNVAALSRTADGFGIGKINLHYTYNKFPDLETHGKKSSSSATKWVRFSKVDNLNDFVLKKKKEGFVFIGADLNKNALRLDEFVFPKKVILVFGSESNGLSAEVRAICDKFVLIPMVGMVESYNISVAAGIFMYELFKQRGRELKLREIGQKERTGAGKKRVVENNN